MGLFAGVLVLRHLRRCPDGEKQQQEGHGGNNDDMEEGEGRVQPGTKAKGAGGGGGGGMPWPSHVLGLPLPLPFPGDGDGDGDDCNWHWLAPPQSPAEWGAAATRHALGLCALTAGGAAWDARLRASHGPELYVNIWWQALVPFSQLTLVVGLARCGGGGGRGGGGCKGKKTSSSSSPPSWLYRALATPFAQWLGKISLGVYLVHEPLIDWLAVVTTARSRSSPPSYIQQLWACAGAGSGRRTGTCDPDCALLVYAGKFLPKTWGIVVVVPLALALGQLLYTLVEEPARRRLRVRGGGG